MAKKVASQTTKKTTKTVVPKTVAKTAPKTESKTETKKSFVAKAENKISSSERYEMITRAAYFKALNRGFAGGNQDYDWVEAEKEVNEYITRNNYSVV